MSLPEGRDSFAIVSDPHRAATQLDWFPVFARHQFIMLKALQRLYWCRLGRFLERRLAGCNPAPRPLRSMQTGQNSIAPENSLPQLGQVRLGSVLIGLTALQPHSERKAMPRSNQRCEIARQGHQAKLFSRSTSNCVFAYLSPSKHISEQNSNRRLLSD
jgi:hypothetical protein